MAAEGGTTLEADALGKEHNSAANASAGARVGRRNTG
jgi:hypothetical protein